MVTPTLPRPWKPGGRVPLGEAWIFARKRGRLAGNELTRDLKLCFFLRFQWLLKLPEFPLPSMFLATGFGVCVSVCVPVCLCVCTRTDLSNTVFPRCRSEKPYNQTSDFFPLFLVFVITGPWG